MAKGTFDMIAAQATSGATPVVSGVASPTANSGPRRLTTGSSPVNPVNAPVALPTAPMSRLGTLPSFEGEATPVQPVSGVAAAVLQDIGNTPPQLILHAWSPPDWAA